MRNADVPMWDKGDATDNYSKGGTSSFNFDSDSSSKKSSLVKEIYLLVFGREPSSREMSYYKYSAMTKEEIIQKLLDSDEHKAMVEKAREHPSLVEKSKLLESSILKLKSYIQDRVQEFQDLHRLLAEKNATIESLRMTKDQPYITDKKLLEVSVSNYSVGSNISYDAPERRTTLNHESFWDRLLKLIFGDKI